MMQLGKFSLRFGIMVDQSIEKMFYNLKASLFFLYTIKKVFFFLYTFLYYITKSSRIIKNLFYGI